MNRIKRITAILLTFYLTSLMISSLASQSVYAQIYPVERPSGFTDVEVKFIVYPNGTVGLSSKYNHTGGDLYSGPSVQASAQMTKDGDMYNASVDTILTVPPEQVSEFPFNATEASMSNEYANNLLNSNINASVVLPDRFDTYGTMYDFSGFPFNATDFTINGEYANETFNGTITIHMIPDLALGDVDVHFEGNTTQITISDSITVFYDVPLPIPGFTPLNETYVNNILQMLNSTIPGEQAGSLHDMTDGMLNCTTFNTTLAPKENGADVSFLVVIQGDFIAVLAQLFTAIPVGLTTAITVDPRLPPRSPPVYPQFNATTFYPLINATAYSVKTGEFTVSYSKTAKNLDLQAAFTQDYEKYLNATTQMMPEVQPDMQPYLESILNTTYSSVHSYTEELSYDDGQMSYQGDYAFVGDLNQQVNHVKNVYIDMLNAANPGPEWIINTIKNTTVDISNLRFTLDVNNVSQVWDFEGVKITPPVNRINATCFRLEKLFNITSSQYREPPLQNERIKLIAQGGSNGTHTVTLFADPDDPEKVPDPDKFAAGNTMIWNNQSISKLKRLTFKVWEGCVETIQDPASVTTENPLTIDAQKTAGCILTLTNISKPATIHIKNITEPTDINPPPGTYKLLGSYKQITADPPDATANVTIRIYYTPEQLSKSGLDENSLEIFYWDNVTNKWEPIDTQINTEEHYVWATVTHLSMWALMGQPLPPLWEQPWFLISTIVIAAIVIIAAILTFRRMKQEA